jgi:hypothetical protein
MLSSTVPYAARTFLTRARREMANAGATATTAAADSKGFYAMLPKNAVTNE